MHKIDARQCYESILALRSHRSFSLRPSSELDDYRVWACRVHTPLAFNTCDLTACSAQLLVSETSTMVIAGDAPSRTFLLVRLVTFGRHRTAVDGSGMSDDYRIGVAEDVDESRL